MPRYNCLYSGNLAYRDDARARPQQRSSSPVKTIPVHGDLLYAERTPHADRECDYIGYKT